MRLFLPILVLTVLPSLTQGQIATDGTVGTLEAQTLTSENNVYTIGQELGELSDNNLNLFHSFDQFSIANGETALFTGDDTIRNVISRVTGGEVSNIDGMIRSTIGTADFYFINPAGVLFGPNAKLDLPGAFHVSTADYIELGDDELFYSNPMESDVLSTAAPTAFGFLDDSIGEITINGASLELTEEQTLSIVGGGISLNNGSIATKSGHINLVSVNSPGNAMFKDVEAGFETNEFTGFGDSVLDGFNLDVSGDLGGGMFVRSSNLTVQNGASLDASTLGGGAGESGDLVVIDIENHLQLLNRGVIDVSTSSSGNGGNAKIEASNLTIDGRNNTSPFRINGLFTGIASGAKSGSTGNGGNLKIVVTNYLQLLSRGVIDVSTYSAGNGGNAKIAANDLTLDKFADISSSAFLGSTGSGGELDITVLGHLQLLNGGVINVSSDSFGSGGNAEIVADNLTLDHGRILNGAFRNGNGGNLSLTVNNLLKILNSGEIDSSATNFGTAGSITIRGKDLLLENDGKIVSSAVFRSDFLQNNVSDGFGIDILTDIAVPVSLSLSKDELLNRGFIDINANGDIVLTDKLFDLVPNTIVAYFNETNEFVFRDGIIDGLPDAGIVGIKMSGDVILRNNSEISTASTLANAGTMRLFAEGDIIIDFSEVSVRAGQGVFNEDLTANTKFTLENLDRAGLDSFLSEFVFPDLEINSGGTIRVNKSEIDASAGLLAGSVNLTAADEIIINQSTVSLEVDQRAMNLAGVWDSFRDQTTGTVDGVGFADEFPKLFSNLTIEAENAIRISNSTLTTNAGLEARALDLANNDTSKIRGFGGSIELHVPPAFPTQIALSNSRLEAQSYTMGGNVIIDPYYYVVNNSDVITSADVIGGDYIINAAFLLQSLDSVVDLSGQQSGSFVSSAVDVDLGSELSELKAEFLNPESFVQVSCDQYYLQERSSFIVKSAKVQLSECEDYLPSKLPDYLNALILEPSASDAEGSNGANLPRLNDDCADCI